MVGASADPAVYNLACFRPYKYLRTYFFWRSFSLYLPLALMISMMMFFSWAALPGIALGIFVRKYAELGLYETISLTVNFIIIIILCWGAIRCLRPGVTTFHMVISA